MTETKLTKPQEALLSEISERPQSVTQVYAPANKLVFLGLATWVEGRFSDTLHITEAGRAALQQGGGDHV